MFFISSFLERVGLQGHFATNLYQNLTVIGRSVQNRKYQALSQQTLLLLLLRPQNQYFMSYLSFTIFSGFHLVRCKRLEGVANLQLRAMVINKVYLSFS